LLVPRFPSPVVLAAFGASSVATPLPGGQGTSFRAGSLVLKPVEFPYEEQSALLFERLEGSGFRVPRPVRASDDRFVVNGWTATEFIDAHDPGPNGGNWPETIAACRAFHAALATVPIEPWREVFDLRTDPWAEADRLTFGERTVDPLNHFRGPIARLTRLLRPMQVPSQLIHGDFTANVLFAHGELPCVIDFSPYWRPAEFALGVVVADAITWGGADESILDLCADVPDFAQWLARGVLRRIWELDQHSRCGRTYSADHLAANVPAILVVEGLIPGA